MRKSSNRDIFMLMFGFTFFSGSMLIGRNLADGMSFKDFLFCTGVGGAVLGLFGGILAYISCKTEKDLETLMVDAFGRNGSRIPSLFISITQIGWYGVGISMFAVPVTETLFPGTHAMLYVLIAVFGFAMTASTFHGISAITRLSYIAVPVIAILGTGIIVYSLGVKDDNLLQRFGTNDQIQVMTGLEMVIGSYISGSITTPNFTWNAINAKNASIISFLAFFAGNGLMFVFGALSRILSGGSDIFELFTFYHLKFVGIIVLGLNIWSSCDNGLYSAGLGLENVIGIQHQYIMLIAGIFSTLLSLPLYNHLIEFLSLLNRTLPHIGVILILSYFFPLSKRPNQHLSNLLAVLSGAAISLITRFGIPIINGMVVTVGVYFIFTVRRHSTYIGRGKPL